MATSYITDFIQSLSSEEIKIVKEYVYKPGNKHLLGENKIEKLFNTLVGDPARKFTDKELSGVLESNAGALRVLKSRLFDRAKEALLSDKHYENNLVFNESQQFFFSLKKKLQLVKTLYRTLTPGRIETINSLLAETIKIAKEREIYDVLVEALTFYKYIKGIRLGAIEFEKVNKEITFYDDCLKCVRNANDYFYQLVLNKAFINSFTEKELEQHLRLTIKKMEIDLKRTNAQEVNYYMHHLKIALYEEKKNYQQAIVYCTKLTAILKNSKVLYTNDRMGFALGNLCQFKIFAGKYKEAATHAKNALKFHIKMSFNYLTLKEQQFYAHFYASSYKEALKYIKEMLQYSSVDTGEFRKSKFIYYQICIFFAIKQFKDALQLFSKPLEIEKDKIGWNVAVRILMTMLFIELSKFNEASTSISTLRKHIERTGKTKEIKDRDVLILKLLRELEKDGFKRNEKNKTAGKLLTELSDKNKSTAWNYFTPELIPFHEWVKTLPEKIVVQKK